MDSPVSDNGLFIVGNLGVALSLALPWDGKKTLTQQAGFLSLFLSPVFHWILKDWDLYILRYVVFSLGKNEGGLLMR